jgi:hypothetical protein
VLILPVEATSVIGAVAGVAEIARGLGDRGAIRLLEPGQQPAPRVRLGVP